MAPAPVTAPEASWASLLTGDWPGVETIVSVFSPIIGRNCSLMSPVTRMFKSCQQKQKYRLTLKVSMSVINLLLCSHGFQMILRVIAEINESLICKLS